MDTAAFLSYLISQPTYYEQIAHIEHIRPHEARYAELAKPLETELEECLKNRNFLPLYTHQAEAVNHALDGKNVIVATPSASGKSLCYNIPVLQTLLTADGRPGAIPLPDQSPGAGPAARAARKLLSRFI